MMARARILFSAETIVGDAVAADPTLATRLADFNPAFGQLRDPHLRETFARLVTFADAADIAGVPLDALLAVANGTGEAALIETPEDAPPANNDADDGAPPSWRDASGVHIDVRGLPPPEPMRAILGLIETPATGDVVIVHHDREPIFLYPELAERGWQHEIVASPPGEVRLRLRRQAP